MSRFGATRSRPIAPSSTGPDSWSRAQQSRHHSNPLGGRSRECLLRGEHGQHDGIARDQRGHCRQDGNDARARAPQHAPAKVQNCTRQHKDKKRLDERVRGAKWHARSEWTGSNESTPYAAEHRSRGSKQHAKGGMGWVQHRRQREARSSRTGVGELLQHAELERGQEQEHGVRSRVCARTVSNNRLATATRLTVGGKDCVGSGIPGQTRNPRNLHTHGAMNTGQLASRSSAPTARAEC